MGTRGVPAQYGGFETAVEEIGTRLAARGHIVTVYCRNPGQHITHYRGMHLVNLPAVRHRTTETLSHSGISAVHAVLRDRPDVVFLLNAGNAPVLAGLNAAGVPTAIHLDGLESRRAKWRGAGARYYRWAERTSARIGKVVIADAQAIADYVQDIYGRECVVIPYGAEIIHPSADRLSDLNLEPGEYHLVVARFEPENHVMEAVHAFRASEENRPLVVVGGAPYSPWYVDRVRTAALGDPRIRLLGSVYDQELINVLYAHALTYVHGHSVGGTNPSLLRAMGAGAPVLAYDVEFNREVTNDQALFWGNAEELTVHFNAIAHGEYGQLLPLLAEQSRERVRSHYQWEAVTDQYEALMHTLVKAT